MNLKKTAENLIVYIFFGVFLFLGYSVVSKKEDATDNLLKVYFLDVGQGDATLIETPDDHYILIDGGPDKSVLTELGEILPAYGKKIDALILSHPHADHLSGFNYVLDRYEVEKIYLTGATHNTPDFEAFLEKIKENKVSTEILNSGDEVCYLEICLDVLWPDEGKISNYDLNDSSMIVNLNYGESDIVFLGDVSSDVQENIINRFNFDAEVIKASHHGSKTGTSKKILGKIVPEIAVISAGEGNYFNHPAKSVLELLSGQIILRTDKLGTINIKTDGKTIHY
jgi:competence protein ComEC